MRALDVKDAQLAPVLGISRSAVQGWRTGGVRLRADQCEQAAAALGVPFDLFEEEVDGVLRWLADNRREQVYAASGWFSEFSDGNRVLAQTG